MAVRHLKRYVSWVQTVQQFIPMEWKIERFEPRGKTNNDIFTAAIHSNMYREAN